MKFEVAAAVGAICGPVVTYLIAHRKLSGKIGTSEAADLWKEARLMRDDYRERLEALELRIVSLETENTALRAENVICKAEVRRLQRRITALSKSFNKEEV